MRKDNANRERVTEKFMGYKCNNIINRCIQSRSRNMILYESWFKRKSDLSYIKIFGFVTYVHVPKELNKKFWLWKPKSNKIFLVIIIRYKSFSQKRGIDFDEIYSLVVRCNSIRLLLAIAAIENLEIRKFGIKTAFINEKIETKIIYEDSWRRKCKSW